MWSFIDLAICFLILTFFSSLWFFCWKNSWQEVFSHSVGCLFVLLIVSCAVQQLFNLMPFNLLRLALICWAISILFKKSFLIWCLFFFCCHAFDIISKKSLPRLRPRSLSPIFSVRIFKFPEFTFVFNSPWIFVYGIREDSHFTLFHMNILNFVYCRCFPFPVSILGNFVKDWLLIYAWVYIWTILFHFSICWFLCQTHIVVD